MKRFLLIIGLVVGVVSIAEAQGPFEAQIQLALRAFLAASNTWSGNQVYNGDITINGSCTGCSGLPLAHDMLSTSHADTTPAAVTRGALITGHAGPVWAELALGSAGAVLTSNGVDVTWSTSGASLTNLNATNVSSGTLAIAYGGTNSSTALNNTRVMVSSGGAIVENASGTANQLLHGDLTWAAITLTTQVTGVLPIANGGTNATATPTAGGAAYGTGTALAWTSAGTTGQILTSNGAGAPAWADPTAASAHNLLSSTHTDTLAASPPTRGDIIAANSTPKWARLALGTAGKVLQSNGTDPGWSTIVLPQSATAGDVIYASGTSTYANLSDVATGNVLISGGVGTAPSWGKVGLTTHISGTLAVGNGGTGIASGTSGGVPYFSGSTTIASSGALTQYAVVLGGGAAGAPNSVSGVGTSGQVLTSNGAGTNPTWQAAAASGSACNTYTAQTGTYSAVAADFVVATSGTFTVTLPAASSNANKEICVVNAGSGTITIGRTGSDKVGNQAETSQTLNPGDAFRWHSDGSGTWYIGG